MSRASLERNAQIFIFKCWHHVVNWCQLQLGFPRTAAKFALVYLTPHKTIDTSNNEKIFNLWFVDKKKRVSKKNKASWRKHTDIKDVEAFLEEQRQEERIG